MIKVRVMSLPEFYRRYIEKCEFENVKRGLLISGDEALDFYKSIGPARYDHRYREGKWSIREILGHVIDGERVFAYRAMSFARGEKQALPGFEQDDYIPHMNLGVRPMNALITEFANLRASTIDLFSGFSDQMLQMTGVASGHTFSVEQLGRILVGHEVHHRRVISERYLMN